ncbi:MAG TPA: outer membrane beta-barrel protein [Vicinamibacterales bacterium]|nr:outer membrane beta-barrel protein [Vicinamibacterales bacterium]
MSGPSHRSFAGASAVAVLLTFAPHPAQAQAKPSKVELSAVVNWIGGFDMATADALEFDRAGNGVATFSTDGRLEGTFGYGGRMGFALTDRLAAEGSVVYSAPTLTIDVADDIEGAAAASASERIHQYAIDGAALYYLRSRGARTRPFLLGGAGYLRELHEGQTLGANGQTYFGGGGIVRTLSGSKVRLALRVDARVVARTKGIALDGDLHLAPVASGSLIFGF